MSALKLFISHSSRLDEPEIDNDPENNPNLKLLLEVIQAVKQEYGDTIDILVDKDAEKLPAAVDWEKRLNEWLAECHAAIILFSKRAVENSNWVKKEATILSWRRELEEEFTLIPICIKDQTTPEQLEEDLFGTLRINKNQCIRDVQNSQDILVGIKLALGEKETLESKCRLTPFDKLKGVIVELLTSNASSQTLEDAWGQLPDTGDKPSLYPDPKAGFANALTRYLLRDSSQCVENYQTIINHIRPKVQKEHAEEILEYIRSLWVDAKAAGSIPYATKHQCFLALNGRFLNQYTCKCYAERAWPMDNNYKLVLTSQTDEPRLMEEIRDHFQLRRAKLSPEQCDSRINAYSRQVVVYLTASQQQGSGLLDDPRLRRKLKDNYPKAIFILGTGDELPVNKAKDICLVKPELDLGTETKSLVAEDNFYQFLDDYYGQ